MLPATCAVLDGRTYVRCGAAAVLDDPSARPRGWSVPLRPAAVQRPRSLLDQAAGLCVVRRARSADHWFFGGGIRRRNRSMNSQRRATWRRARVPPWSCRSNVDVYREPKSDDTDDVCIVIDQCAPSLRRDDDDAIA